MLQQVSIVTLMRFRSVLFKWGTLQFLIVVWNSLQHQARRQDLAAGGTKNQKGGPHLKNTVLDVCSNPGAKREMGGHRFQMGGPGTTDPPLATALCNTHSNLCITFVIAGNFDKIITRSGLILLILKQKLRERKETNNS